MTTKEAFTLLLGFSAVFCVMYSIAQLIAG